MKKLEKPSSAAIDRPRRHETGHGKPPRPLFCAVRPPGNAPIERYPADVSWSGKDFAIAASDRFEEVFARDSLIQARLDRMSKPCAVLVVESMGFPDRRDVLDQDGYRDRIKKLLLSAMSGSGRAEGNLLTPEDASAGQVRGIVVLVEDREAARDWFELMEKTGFREDDDGVRRRQTIEALLRPIEGASFEATLERVNDLEHLTKLEIAKQLEPALNQRLRSTPHGTYEEKQSAASWINNTIRPLGLAVRCPNTGRPGIVVADRQGGVDDVGRFRVEIRDEHGGRARTASSKFLPDFELMVDLPRPEPLAKWTDDIRHRPKSKRSK